jgi:uncharacterized protein with PQ loop repeat
MTYHLTGIISALTFLLTVSGLWSQLQLVWKRKRDFQRGGTERPTAVLSLNQFVSSFLAFFSFFLYGGCLQRFALLLGSPALFLAQSAAVAWGRVLSQGLVVIVTIILAQGYLHQVVLIRQTGRTGAVSLRLHQFFLWKDITTIAFALAMGWAAGWPLLLLSSVGAATKLATMWHFRWARLSVLARQRREGVGALHALETPSINLPE